MSNCDTFQSRLTDQSKLRTCLEVRAFNAEWCPVLITIYRAPIALSTIRCAILASGIKVHRLRRTGQWLESDLALLPKWQACIFKTLHGPIDHYCFEEDGGYTRTLASGWLSTINQWQLSYTRFFLSDMSATYGSSWFLVGEWLHGTLKDYVPSP